LLSLEIFLDLRKDVVVVQRIKTFLHTKPRYFVLALVFCGIFAMNFLLGLGIIFRRYSFFNRRHAGSPFLHGTSTTQTDTMRFY
jgi:hypothetical protein